MAIYFRHGQMHLKDNQILKK